MSIDSIGPVGVQARILEIQRRFAPAAPVASRSATGNGTAGTGSTTNASFASALAGFLPGADVGSAQAATGPASAFPASTFPGAGEQVVADAKRYLGVPYVWGGTDPAKGLDCSGLVQRVYADLGVDLPRVAADQARAGQPVASLADARPGDLLAFGSPVDHIGIYAGNNTMVVAPKTGDVVKVESIYRTPSAIRRILPDGSAPTAAGFDAGLLYPVAATPATGTATVPAAYRSLFEQAGQRYGVAPSLLAAVAHTESNFDPNAVSGAGAVGLMQLMPGTARGLGVDPRDPAQAVDGAARLLSGHLRTYGSVPLALAAYNAGPGSVDRYGGVPPFAETQAYVQRVLDFQKGTTA